MLSSLLHGVNFLPNTKTERQMPRPFSTISLWRYYGDCPIWRVVSMYLIPGSGSTLKVQEWLMAGGWALMGAIFFALNRESTESSLVNITNIT